MRLCTRHPAQAQQAGVGVGWGGGQARPGQEVEPAGRRPRYSAWTLNTHHRPLRSHDARALHTTTTRCTDPPPPPPSHTRPTEGVGRGPTCTTYRTVCRYGATAPPPPPHHHHRRHMRTCTHTHRPAHTRLERLERVQRGRPGLCHGPCGAWYRHEADGRRAHRRAQVADLGRDHHHHHATMEQAVACKTSRAAVTRTGAPGAHSPHTRCATREAPQRAAGGVMCKARAWVA